MEKQKLTTTEHKNLEDSLQTLGIQDLEERLEVSALAGGGGVMGQDGFIDISIENCCNGGKCSGNTLPEVDEALGHDL